MSATPYLSGVPRDCWFEIISYLDLTSRIFISRSCTFLYKVCKEKGNMSIMESNRDWISFSATQIQKKIEDVVYLVMENFWISGRVKLQRFPNLKIIKIINTSCQIIPCKKYYSISLCGSTNFRDILLEPHKSLPVTGIFTFLLTFSGALGVLL